MNAKAPQYEQMNYDQLPPFTSFLPGIAGLNGHPIWAYYVNRGQGICSFGIEDKAHAIMEFQPAVRAYEDTEINGFRTFLNISHAGNTLHIEPFSREEERFTRNLSVSENRLKINAISRELGISVDVNYFVLPNAPYGGLVRRVKICNCSSTKMDIEGLDGMARLIPYGILNDEHLNLSNILRSFVTLKRTSFDFPVFTLRSSTADSDRVDSINGGIFVATYVNSKPSPILYDRKTIFGEWSTLRSPILFYRHGLASVLETPQVYENKLPCAFTPFLGSLNPGEEVRLDQVYGFSASIENVDFTFDFDNKQVEADSLLNNMLDDISMRSGMPAFDAYMRQSYLDNLLRGGYPEMVNLCEKPVAIHVYSRKHGDPERDYNFFVTSSEPWSQGNGNFRDVCQNRRNDVFFHPDAGLQNMHQFLSFLQADGYNPLEIRGVTLRLRPQAIPEFNTWLEKQTQFNRALLKQILETPISPGKLFSIEGLIDRENLLTYLEPVFAAAHREGYWIDHWVYLLDLVEGALKVFPDQTADLLFGDNTLTFYQSAYRVKPRADRYVYQDDSIKQYDSVFRDEELYERIGETGCHLLYLDGTPVTVSVYGKLFLLAALKFSTLDSLAAGLEMEAAKPGWNDAMNGLPALRGSSIADTLELKRLLLFLQQFENQANEVLFPKVMADFIMNLGKDWDQRNSLREDYREAIRDRIPHEIVALSISQLITQNRFYLRTIEEGLCRARELSQEFLPTYLVFDPEPRALPHFLEAPAKELKTLGGDEAKDLYERVQNSTLYDKKIRMFKTSESLKNEAITIGRIRTFTPGWLERESIFMHMHYKFLFGMLCAGLYEEFFQEIRHGLIPFYDSEIYGRSTLEHSSFIASSVNPDPSLHGRGFISRLSGATAEALSMWVVMLVGKIWFSWNDSLSFTFAPILPDWLFDEAGSIQFKLLSHSVVTYHNPLHRSTFGSSAVQPFKILISDDSVSEEIFGASLPSIWAEKLRAGKQLKIEVELR